MNDSKLSKEEKQILADFEAGEFKFIFTLECKKILQTAAEETFKKDKRVNIRISSRRRYYFQTLFSCVLHKYVSGGLHDIMAKGLLAK